MKKTLWWIIAVIVIILIILGITSKKEVKVPQEGEKQTVKIGFSLPLSGDLGFIGEGARNAILLAQSELGETYNNYEVIFEDDKFEAKSVASIINKFISVDKVDVISSFGSLAGNVTTPITQDNNITHVNIGASDGNVANGEYNFIHWTSPEKEIDKLIEELNKKNLKNVAIITENLEVFIAINNSLNTKIEDKDIDIVFYEIFNQGTTDFKSIIAKSKKVNPDIYLLLAVSPEIEILEKQMQELNIEKPRTSIESFDISEQLDLFEGYWFIGAGESDDEFKNKFFEAYNENESFGAANSYDVFNIIVTASENAAKKGKEVNSDTILEEIYNLKTFEGALGHLVIPESGIIESEATVKMIIDGKPVVIEE